MADSELLKKLSIIIMALIGLFLTRMGISYLIILTAIGFIGPFVSGNKRSAVLSGALYATLSYIISYPSGLHLIEYMPTAQIPIEISSTATTLNLITGWLIPVAFAIIICSIASVIGNFIKNIIYPTKEVSHDDQHYFEIDRTNQDYSSEYTHHTMGFDQSEYNDSTFEPYQPDYTDSTVEVDHFDYDDSRFETDTSNHIDTNKLNKKEKEELLYLTPIQKAKNRKKQQDKGR